MPNSLVVPHPSCGIRPLPAISRAIDRSTAETIYGQFVDAETKYLRQRNENPPPGKKFGGVIRGFRIDRHPTFVDIRPDWRTRSPRHAGGKVPHALTGESLTRSHTAGTISLGTTFEGLPSASETKKENMAPVRGSLELRCATAERQRRQSEKLQRAIQTVEEELMRITASSLARESYKYHSEPHMGSAFKLGMIQKKRTRSASQ
eukprot:GEMP01081845.1.p1 GENE.GEMP01081845.1~~GEMP01081845.1.p1  ORF type:complete len:205 (+),score=41.34 GEMP01081845.1:31-645(+)